MRKLSSVELNRIKILTENSVELTLIEPTKIGLEKSILDATAPVRIYLKEKRLHEYDIQKQGPNYKVQINAYFIDEFKLSPSIASLYRPTSKKGDPRIWFKRLPEIAKPNDIIGIIGDRKVIYVINLSHLDIERLLKSTKANPLKDVIAKIRLEINEVADELLFKLRKIAQRGFIPADLNADTSVGRTLERLLDIKINSSKTPDFKGIELKSFRDKRDNRKNLFAQVSNWELSKFKSSAEILETFGRCKENDFRLYCTVSSLKKNQQGLKLRIDNKKRWLLENSDNPQIGDFLVWTLETLHRRLQEKHNETFWIAAESKTINEQEYFIYNKVEHTKKPIVSQLDILIEQGIVTLDHLIKKDQNNKVVEKGPLFKIRSKSLSLLFPPSKFTTYC